MKYLSLFSGIGGFELGIKNAYVEMSNRNKNGKSKENPKANDETGQRLVASNGQDTDHETGQLNKLPHRIDDEGAPHCIGFSEIDKHATQIYQKHFPQHKNYGDITKINASDLPEFDLLVGGFPCQSFSIAGKRRGFEDTRGTMFFEIARILKEKQPRLLLLENVKGLLSHEEGRTFTTIISTLDELGYDIQWQVLNSKNFGVPQNRERVFIIGHLRGSGRSQVFPIFGSEKESTGKADKQGCASTLTGRSAGGQNRRGNYIAGTLRTHKDGNGFRKIKGDIAPTIPARAREDGSGQPVVSIDTEIRRLTPIECERLQGFPDGWTEGISDTQRYKTLGNAVTVNVIREISKRIL